MKTRLTDALLAAALLAALPTPALACSVVPDYRVPTNLELAQSAELILLGRVTGERVSADTSGWDGGRAILVEPISALKGTLPTEPVAISGKSLAEGEMERYGVVSNPYELEAAHPASYIGGCIRYIFPRDTTVLFFLERTKDGKGWQPAGGPFSRWAEDALSEDAPWLRLTRLYASVAAAPEGERKALLEKERAVLAAKSGDVVARLMAEDIARQLTGPNKTWNAMMSEMSGPAGSEPEAAADALADAVMEATSDGPAEGMAEPMISEDGDSITATAEIPKDPKA